MKTKSSAVFSSGIAVFVLGMAVTSVFVFRAVPDVFARTPPVLITEVAVDESGGKDWVELYVTRDGVDLTGYTLKVNDSVRIAASTIITFSTTALPSGLGRATFDKGTYIIVEVSQPSVTYEKKSNTYYSVSSTFSTTGTEGIRATEGVLHLYSGAGLLVDALAWTSADDYALNNRVVDAYTIVASSEDLVSGTMHWSPSEAVPANCAFFRSKSGTNEPGTSLARKPDSAANPIDTNTKNDWAKLRRPTKGYGYEKLDLPSVSVAITGNNPFSPYDPSYKTTKISFNIEGSTAAVKTMRVYDIRGRERAVLINQDVLYYSHDLYGRSLSEIVKDEIEWDGRDSNGNILPVGIYIVYLEAYDKAMGKMITGKATVAIGRKGR